MKTPQKNSTENYPLFEMTTESIKKMKKNSGPGLTLLLGVCVESMMNLVRTLNWWSNWKLSLKQGM